MPQKVFLVRWLPHLVRVQVQPKPHSWSVAGYNRTDSTVNSVSTGTGTGPTVSGIISELRESTLTRYEYHQYCKGASSGQFHGGVDELPASYDNKSFVLKAGERVVQPEANKKLTSFLDNQEKSNSTGGDITINAPLIVQGDVSGSDAKFNEMLKKHANNVNQAVRTAQRRNT
jgi:hypothetical protein